MKAVYLKQGNNKVVSVPYYRVGDLFLTTIATNPSNYLGGTWELYGPGRVLVCVNTSDSNFNTVKKTGGAKTVTLTVNQIPAHNHGMDSAGGHNHTNQWDGYSINSGNQFKWVVINGGSNQGVNTSWAGDHTHTIHNTGGGQAHSNLQPYITCYVWIRTA